MNSNLLTAQPCTNRVVELKCYYDKTDKMEWRDTLTLFYLEVPYLNHVAFFFILDGVCF